MSCLPSQVWRILKLENVEEPANNYEVVAGTGERCVPGSEDRSVDNSDIRFQLNPC